MKIGITYLYTISTYGYPPLIDDDFRALSDIERMGFHYLEMEALGPEHAEVVWSRRTELKNALQTYGIHVHNFCAVDPDLVSIEEGVRAKALERFRRTAELGAFLGAETLHLASYAPPVEYLSGQPYALGEEYLIPSRLNVHIPDGFCWERVWETLVDSCQKTASIASETGRTVIMEPRIGEIICSPDSLIRLINDVSCPNFKANFDTGHFSAQRENVPLALMKLENMFANVHISDNTPSSAEHVAIGEGGIDWLEFFRILKKMNYKGYLGLDLGASQTLQDDLRRSVTALEKIGRELDIVFDI